MKPNNQPSFKGIYLMGGYPNIATYDQILQQLTLCDNPPDFIEIGLPYSDPAADGHLIAQAAESVLNQKISQKEILSILSQHAPAFKKRAIKIYVMTYANIILNYQPVIFSRDFGQILDGLIIADLPNRDHDFFYSRGLTIPLIPFATLQSTEADLQDAAKCRGDFIYIVSMLGITGSATDLNNELVKEQIAALKKITDKQLVLGFGINSRSTANQAVELAGGAIIGSAAVKMQTQTATFMTFINEICH